ncbi:2290_t:CDS:1, partial [Dentiscutata heterogama]
RDYENGRIHWVKMGELVGFIGKEGWVANCGLQQLRSVPYPCSHATFIWLVVAVHIRSLTQRL